MSLTWSKSKLCRWYVLLSSLWLRNLTSKLLIYIYFCSIYVLQDVVFHIAIQVAQRCLKLKMLCPNRLIGLVGRVFANGPGDLASIPGRVIPKTLKMVLDTSLLNTQQYKVRMKDKVEQSRERSSGLSNTEV